MVTTVYKPTYNWGGTTLYIPIKTPIVTVPPGDQPRGPSRRLHWPRHSLPAALASWQGAGGARSTRCCGEQGKWLFMVNILLWMKTYRLP